MIDPATAAVVVLTSVVGYWIARKLGIMGQTEEFPQVGRVVPLVDLQNQTVEYPSGSGERYIATIRDGVLRPFLFEGVDTIYKALRFGAKKENMDGMAPCLGKRSKEGNMDYEWMNFSEVGCALFGAKKENMDGMAPCLGKRSKEGNMDYEWMNFSEVGCALFGAKKENMDGMAPCLGKRSKEGNMDYEWMNFSEVGCALFGAKKENMDGMAPCLGKRSKEGNMDYEWMNFSEVGCALFGAKKENMDGMAPCLGKRSKEGNMDYEWMNFSEVGCALFGAKKENMDGMAPCLGKRSKEGNMDYEWMNFSEVGCALFGAKKENMDGMAPCLGKRSKEGNMDYEWMNFSEVGCALFGAKKENMDGMAPCLGKRSKEGNMDYEWMNFSEVGCALFGAKKENMDGMAPCLGKRSKEGNMDYEWMNFSEVGCALFGAKKENMDGMAPCLGKRSKEGNMDYEWMNFSEVGCALFGARKENMDGMAPCLGKRSKEGNMDYEWMNFSEVGCALFGAKKENMDGMAPCLGKRSKEGNMDYEWMNFSEVGCALFGAKKENMDGMAPCLGKRSKEGNMDYEWMNFSEVGCALFGAKKENMDGMAPCLGKRSKEGNMDYEWMNFSEVGCALFGAKKENMDGMAPCLGKRSKEGNMDYEWMNFSEVGCALFGAKKENMDGMAPCLGKRSKEGNMDYEWMNFSEVIEASENIAAGLRSKGIPAGEDSRIGIFAQNCPEWVIMEHACYVYSMVNVPLYDTLGPEACNYIIEQAKMKLVFCGSNEKGLALLKDPVSVLRTLVLLDPPSPELIERAKACGVELVTYDDLLKDGASMKFKWAAEPPSPHSVATICYTSGTTGPPKGAVLTHENLTSNTCCVALMTNIKLVPGDCMVSYLPLAHMFERLLEVAVYSMGGRVGFYRGDVKLLLDDLKALRPTVFPTVPRLLNRIRDKIVSEVNRSAIKRRIFQCALNAKRKQLKRGIIRNDTCWDKIVFKKVQQALGGRVRLVITGAAPCAPEVLDFCRAAFGCVVVEGYGQTESAAAMSVTLEGDNDPGHVGVPFPSCKIKLVDIPEMNYFASSKQGEVCCKGYNVFKGYFNDPEKTREALDDDGWLHTGDVGEWTETGTLKIIDRKKHIFKLNQGEYVAPEKIENVYIQSKYIAQAFVYGDSLKSFCVAIMVPDPDVMPGAIKKELDISGSMEQLCTDAKVKAHIMQDLKVQAEKAKLHGFEKVHDVFLSPELWSVENELLTPTFKSKRPELKKLFIPKIEKMYADADRQ